MATQSTSSIKRALQITCISIVFVVLVAFGLFQTNELNKSQSELASAQIELTSTQASLAATRASLDITETELTMTKYNLATAQADLTDTETKLNNTSLELKDTSDKLAQTQAEYEATVQFLDYETAFADSLQSSLDNLQANYDSVTAGYDYVVKDPTYQAMQAFLAEDTTNSFTYVTDEFVCHDFAAQVSYNARIRHIRCAYVLIDFRDTNTPGHAIIAFETTDRGIIYIEPQSDETVNLRIGYSYWLSVIPKPGYYYDRPDYDDTVEDIFCLW